MTSFEEFTGDDYSELTHGVRWFADEQNVDIGVIKQDEGVVGGSVVVHEDNYSVLRYLEIINRHRGQKTVDGSLAGSLTDYTVDYLPNSRDIRAQATNVDGKIQHLLQDRDFEISGINLEKNVGSIEENPNGGFNVDFWNLAEDEEIQAYLPEAFHDFVDMSLGEQRTVEYLEPDSSRSYTGSLDVERSKGSIVEADIGEGSSLSSRIEGGLKALGFNDDWAKVVNIDVSEPLAYELSSELLDRGYKPVNMVPKAAGSKLKLARINEEVGIYDITPETSGLIDETGLNYRVLEENELSNKVVFEP